MALFHSLLFNFKIGLIGLAGAAVLRLLSRTLRWELVGLDGEEKFWTDREPRILAFWHAQQLLMPWVYLKARRNKRSKPISVLISQHGDGRMIAKAMSFLGIQSVAGSSSRGGREAMYELIDVLKKGSHIAITPDGPRGPAGKLKAGVIKIAQRSGAAIYPTAIAAQRAWRFKSWDKMFLPKPFSKVVLMMGEKISVPSDLSEDQFNSYTQMVEAALNQLSAKAEQRLGQDRT